MRNCKDDMVVGNPFDQFRFAFHDPLFLQRSLAAGAVTVIAGNSMDFRVPAFFTMADVITEQSGFAFTDTVSSLCLLFIYRMEFGIILIKLVKDFPDRVLGDNTCGRIKDHRDWSHSFRCRCQG